MFSFQLSNLDLSMPPLSTVTPFMDHNMILYLDQGKIMKIDMSLKLIDELKINSKIDDRNSILTLVKLSQHEVLCFSRDNCLVSVIFQEENSKAQIRHKYFVCPYCLCGFSSKKDLSRGHLESHKGPVICRSCQVRRH